MLKGSGHQLVGSCLRLSLVGFGRASEAGCFMFSGSAATPSDDGSATERLRRCRAFSSVRAFGVFFACSREHSYGRAYVPWSWWNLQAMDKLSWWIPGCSCMLSKDMNQRGWHSTRSPGRREAPWMDNDLMSRPSSL